MDRRLGLGGRALCEPRHEPDFCVAAPQPDLLFALTSGQGNHRSIIRVMRSSRVRS